LRGDGTFVGFNSADEVARFFDDVADTYDRKGWEKFSFSRLSAEPVGSQSIFAALTWQVAGADGSLIHEWRQSYSLCRFGERFEIVVSIFQVAGQAAAFS
jgi:hypothetical protein